MWQVMGEALETLQHPENPDTVRKSRNFGWINFGRLVLNRLPLHLSLAFRTSKKSRCGSAVMLTGSGSLLTAMVRRLSIHIYDQSTESSMMSPGLRFPVATGNMLYSQHRRFGLWGPASLFRKESEAAKNGWRAGRG
jgi:hypothetical protein